MKLTNWKKKSIMKIEYKFVNSDSDKDFCEIQLDDLKAFLDLVRQFKDVKFNKDSRRWMVQKKNRQRFQEHVGEIGKCVDCDLMDDCTIRSFFNYDEEENKENVNPNFKKKKQIKVIIKECIKEVRVHIEPFFEELIQDFKNLKNIPKCFDRDTKEWVFKIQNFDLIKKIVFKYSNKCCIEEI